MKREILPTLEQFEQIFVNIYMLMLGCMIGTFVHFIFVCSALAISIFNMMYNVI